MGSELHGRVGLPALQPMCARQHETSSRITPAIRSSFEWLRDMLVEVGERTWPDLSAPPPSIQILGDASEPDSQSAHRPRLGAILLQPGAAPRVMETILPARVQDAFPERGKRINYYELLWPVLAAYVRREQLTASHPVFYEDNEGAKFRLMAGIAGDRAASILLAFF